MIVIAMACRYLKPLPVPDCQLAWSHGELLDGSHALGGEGNLLT